MKTKKWNNDSDDESIPIPKKDIPQDELKDQTKNKPKGDNDKNKIHEAIKKTFKKKEKFMYSQNTSKGNTKNNQ